VPKTYSQTGGVTSLDRETRSFMEHGFAEDFRTVIMHMERDTPDCSPARAIGEHIFISRNWYRPDTMLGRRILAHELAHVVQKRRGHALRPGTRLRPSTDLLVEIEAHAAANVVCSGGLFKCETADPPERPRCWGPAGHYYTTYFVLLCAGVDDAIASKMAFFAQMPDQVRELDATQVEIDRLTFGLRTPNATKGPLSRKEIKSRDNIVQMGLHCLNGRRSEDETKLRRQRLEDAKLPSFKFGLAIHPFGDSFAHRIIDHEVQLYGPGMGHAVELFHGRSGHAPDYVNWRPKLYKEYANCLYEIFCQKSPNSARVGQKDFASGIETIIAEDARNSSLPGRVRDDLQVQKIQRFAFDHGIPLPMGKEAYRPEDECVEWEDFQRLHPELSGDHHLEAALLHARTWT
jgi:Domain of unknown function (DUF4157)